MQYSASAGVSVESADKAIGAEAPCSGEYRSLLPDLLAMIEHVQAGIQMIEQAMARQTARADTDVSGNVVAFDPVHLRYARAGKTLRACDARLDAARRALPDFDAVRDPG